MYYTNENVKCCHCLCADLRRRTEEDSQMSKPTSAVPDQNFSFNLSSKPKVWRLIYSSYGLSYLPLIPYESVQVLRHGFDQRQAQLFDSGPLWVVNLFLIPWINIDLIGVMFGVGHRSSAILPVRSRQWWYLVCHMWWKLHKWFTSFCNF